MRRLLLSLPLMIILVVPGLLGPGLGEWAQAQPDRDAEQTSFSVRLKETVLVFVRGDHERRTTVISPVLGEGERFVPLGTFLLQVNAVTDYELRLSGRMARLTPPEAEIAVDPLPVEVRLIPGSLRGSPVILSGEATRFLPVRRLPGSHRLFQGGNNVKDPTSAALEARVDLKRIPSAPSGTRLRFTLVLTVIEL
jgi:hypothetical protein